MSCQTYLIKPARFELSMLESTTAVDPEPYWATATTYALGEKVLYTASPTSGYFAGVSMLRVFQSLVAGNTSPTTNATHWQDAGPANSVAMFTTKRAEKTTATGPLEVVLDVDDLVTAVAFFGLRGEEMTLTVRREDTTVRSSRVVDLIDRSQVTNWLDFFFVERRYKETIVFLDLDAIPGDTIEVSVTGSATECARMIFGRPIPIGETQMGATWEMDNYTAADEDEFGFVDPVTRDYAPRQNITLRSPRTSTNTVINTLVDLRGTPCVLVASQDEYLANALVNFGLVKDPTIAIQLPTENLVTFEFKGFV